MLCEAFVHMVKVPRRNEESLGKVCFIYSTYTSRPRLQARHPSFDWRVHIFVFETSCTSRVVLLKERERYTLSSVLSRGQAWLFRERSASGATSFEQLVLPRRRFVARPAVPAPEEDINHQYCPFNESTHNIKVERIKILRSSGVKLHLLLSQWLYANLIPVYAARKPAWDLIKPSVLWVSKQSKLCGGRAGNDNQTLHDSNRFFHSSSHRSSALEKQQVGERQTCLLLSRGWVTEGDVNRGRRTRRGSTLIQC